MPRPRIQEILEALRASPSLEAASKKLGMRPEALRLYAAGLAAHGLARLEEALPGDCDCSRCPLASLCGLPKARARASGGRGSRRPRGA